MRERDSGQQVDRACLTEGILRNLSLATGKTVSPDNVFFPPLNCNFGFEETTALIVVAEAAKNGYVKVRERKGNLTFDFSKVTGGSVSGVTLSQKKDGEVSCLIPCQDPFLNPFAVDQKGSVRLNGPQKTTTVLVADLNQGLLTSVELDPEFNKAAFDHKLEDPKLLRKLADVEALAAKKRLEMVQEPLIHTTDNVLRAFGLVDIGNPNLLGDYRLLLPKTNHTNTALSMIWAQQLQVIFALPGDKYITPPILVDAPKELSRYIIDVNLDGKPQKVFLPRLKGRSTFALDQDEMSNVLCDPNQKSAPINKQDIWSYKQYVVLLAFGKDGKIYFTTIEVFDNFRQVFDNSGELVNLAANTEKETVPSETRVLYGPAGQIKDILKKYAEVVRQRNTIYFPIRENRLTVSAAVPAPKPATVTEAPKPLRSLKEILAGFNNFPYDSRLKCQIGVMGENMCNHVRLILKPNFTTIEIFGFDSSKLSQEGIIQTTEILRGLDINSSDKLVIEATDDKIAYAASANIQRWDPVSKEFVNIPCQPLNRTFASRERLASLLSLIEPQKPKVKSNQAERERQVKWRKDYEERRKWIPSPTIFASPPPQPKETQPEEKKPQRFKSKFERKAANKNQKKKK